MPEQSGKADSASVAADDGDSLTVNQGDGQSDVEGEEEEEMGEEEDEEEEGLDGEEEDVEAAEEDDCVDGEYEEFEEEEEEDEVSDAEDEESEEIEEDGGDFEQEEAEEAEEEEDMEGGDAEEQEFKEVEEEDGGNSGDEEMEEEEEEGDGKGEEVAGTGSVEAVTTMQDDAEAAITVQETAEDAITVQEPAEAAATVQEDAKDFCEMVKSGRHDQYQNSLSSTAGDYNAVKHHEQDISKMFSTHSMVFSSTSMGNENSAMAVKPVLSKENGFPNASLGGTYNGIQLGKQSNEAPKSMKNNYLETHGSNPSFATGNASSLLLQKNDLAVEGSVRSDSEIVKNDVSVTGESHLHGITNSQKLDDSNFTCVHTPQRRPRSSSPGVEPDIMNKKPAVTCVFYASGWCIKGKACKFLHQKDCVTTTEQQNKEDKAGHSWISDSRGITEEIVEGSKVSSVVLEESKAEGSSESNSLLHRALVRTYGTGSHETSELHGQYNIQAKGEFQQPDHFQASRALVQEDYGITFGKISHVDSVERQLPDGAFSSRRHVAEEKLVNEFSREDSPYEKTFSRSTHLVDAFAPEYKYFGSSSKVSSLQQNSLSAYGRTEDIASRSAHSHFPNQESYNSHSLSGSRYSGLSSSFQLSQSDNKFSRAETSPKRNSNPSIEYLDDHTKGYLGSRSVSFARDSSPYRSRPDLLYMTHPVDLISRQKTKFQCNDWEPSQPFRPSLSIATSSITSPGSQYDPILDSIEPANASTRDYCFQTSQRTSFQTSQRTSFQNASCWPTNIDTILNGTVTAVSPTFEGTLAKKVSLNDSSAHANVDVLFGSSKLERGDSSIPRNEKAWNPDNLVERSNIKDAEFGGDWRNRADKSKNKESKALKIFHAALVDFMKELVKPWWRDGQLSKDSHKAVIKKSVEKVLSALQSHQVPSTQEAINQYLATSRPKLVKLVEGYVQKYANA